MSEFIRLNELTDGRKTVTAAATAETLVAASTPSKWVVVQALGTNTKALTIGNSTVVHGGAAGTGRRGITLEPGDASEPIYINDLLKIYVDVEVSGEGVQFLYAK